MISFTMYKLRVTSYCRFPLSVIRVSVLLSLISYLIVPYDLHREDLPHPCCLSLLCFVSVAYIYQPWIPLK